MIQNMYKTLFEVGQHFIDGLQSEYESEARIPDWLQHLINIGLTSSVTSGGVAQNCGSVA